MTDVNTFIFIHIQGININIYSAKTPVSLAIVRNVTEVHHYSLSSENVSQVHHYSSSTSSNWSSSTSLVSIAAAVTHIIRLLNLPEPAVYFLQEFLLGDINYLNVWSSIKTYQTLNIPKTSQQ